MIRLSFSTENTCISLPIKFLTWSKYSHVDTVLPDGNLLGSIINIGVHIRPPEPDNRVVRLLALDLDEDKYYKFIRSQLNKRYDLGGIFGFVFRSSRWQDDTKWFCSELVAAAINESYKYKLYSEGVNRVTPSDIFGITTEI